MKHLLLISISLFFSIVASAETLSSNLSCFDDVVAIADTLSMEEMAKSGDADMQFQLGYEYYNGSSKYPQDYQKAVYWCRMAAEEGNERAKLALNNMGVVW